MFTLKPNISGLLDPPRNSLRRTLDHTPLSQGGSHSFTLRLPDSIHAVHPVFHVSQLKPATPNTIPNWTQPPPPPVEVDGELEYKVSEILNSKVDCQRKSCKLLYLVCWAGYKGTDEETSWLLATKLGNASELVEDFYAKYPDKPGPLSNM